jgi:hypothetical protein
MNRPRLLRFALESILYETLKGRIPFDEEELNDDLPILPPVAYKAVEGLMKLLPEMYDDFSNDYRLSRQIAKSVGIKEHSPERIVKTKDVVECEQLRVEADNWYSLGKCLVNAFSKLYLHLVSL